MADQLYVVASGELDVFKDYRDGQGSQKVFHYRPSGVFGELALMYNTPRAATVQATTDVELWSIDRVTFRSLLAVKTQERRKLYSEFLGSVPLLANLDKYEQLKIADSLSTEVFADGDTIIKEGDDANKFYLILEGQVRITKNGKETHNSPLEQWQFFGELALLEAGKRHATCTAIGQVKVASMDRLSFTELLGPCKDIMEREKEDYAGPDCDKDGNSNNPSTVEPPAIARGRRGGVSGESSENLAAGLAWRPARTRRSTSSVSFLEKAIGASFLVSGLSSKDRHELYQTMSVEKYPEGTTIIEQGDLDASKLYVVCYGELDVMKDMGNGEGPVKVFHYTEGQIFGELALMYGTPRAASVISKSNVKLFTVDRITFRTVLMQGAKRRRELYSEFLASIPVLQNLEHYERLKVADALVTNTFASGEIIVQEGDPGERFYLILEGQVKVTRKGEETHNSPLEPWQYFGELALLNDDKRLATCSAVGHVQLASMDRESFDSLLGPVKEIMTRNQSFYSPSTAVSGLSIEPSLAGRRASGERRNGLSGERRNGISSEPMPVDESAIMAEPVDISLRSDAEVELLERSLGGSLLVANLDFRGRRQVYDAMQLVSVQAGTDVISQGDTEAHHFYVVIAGELDVYKDSGSGKAEKVFHYKEGGLFGELALMYNTPRAATVRTVTDSKLWSLNRTTFRNTLMRETKRRRERFSLFLGQVPLLKNLDRYELLKIADSLTPDMFEKGDVIVEEGSDGDRFYLIVSGSITITVDGKETPNSPLSEGQFFGELALLSNAKRAATCTAANTVQVAYMRRKDFTRLMGPLKDILERGKEDYKKE